MEKQVYQAAVHILILTLSFMPSVRADEPVVLQPQPSSDAPATSAPQPAILPPAPVAQLVVDTGSFFSSAPLDPAPPVKTVSPGVDKPATEKIDDQKIQSELSKAFKSEKKPLFKDDQAEKNFYDQHMKAVSEIVVNMIDEAGGEEALIKLLKEKGEMRLPLVPKDQLMVQQLDLASVNQGNLSSEAFDAIKEGRVFVEFNGMEVSFGLNENGKLRITTFQIGETSVTIFADAQTPLKVPPLRGNDPVAKPAPNEPLQKLQETFTGIKKDDDVELTYLPSEKADPIIISGKVNAVFVREFLVKVEIEGILYELYVDPNGKTLIQDPRGEFISIVVKK